MADYDLNTVLAEFLEAEDTGRRPDRKEFIARHPQFAAELQEFFANQEGFSSLAEPLVPIAAPSGSYPRGGSRRAEPVARDDSSFARGGSAARRFGNYELLDEIARGGMGVVFKARHAELDRIVALKMVLGGQFASPADIERFRIEAQAAAHLDHPNIVPIYEVGEHDGQHFFTMKFVEGRNLADDLGEWASRPRDAAQLVATIAHAVHYAHQRGVLHRDLKPANILLGEGQASRVKGREPEQSSDESNSSGPRPSTLVSCPFITDFGLAKCLAAESDLTQSGAVLGTPTYMAPEQAAGKPHQATTAADVYSLGAILYAMLTGRPPFRADTPAETLRQVMEHEPPPPSGSNANVDRDVETICLKCLEKDPRRRYGSAEALAEDLERWLGGLPIRARRVGGWERMIKWARRKPAAAALVAVSAAAVLTVLASSLWYNDRLQAEIRQVAREKQQAQQSFDRAELERTRAEDRERIGRRHLYAAHMNLAQQAWEMGQLGRMRVLLDGQRPGPEEEDLRSFEWYYLWRLSLRGLQATLAPPSQPARTAVFARDGRSVLSGGQDGRIREIDVATGNVRSEWQAHPGGVFTLMLSQDGGTLASSGSDGYVRVWNRATNSERFAARVRVDAPAAVSPDGNLIAFAEGGPILVHDTITGQELAKLSGHTSAVNELAFSPDGRLLASVSNDASVRLWDVEAKRQIATLRGHRVYSVSVAFSPDGRHVASGDEGGTVILWGLPPAGDSFDSSSQRVQQRHQGTIEGLSFSPDGALLASAGEDGTVRVSDLGLGQEHEQVFGHPGPVNSVAFSPEGDALVSAGADGAVRLWTVPVEAKEEPKDAIGRHSMLVYSLAFSPDGRTLASASQDQTIRLWDAARGAESATLLGHTGSVVSLAFSPNGNLIASGNNHSGTQPLGPDGEGGSVRLWDAASGRLLNRFRPHDQAAWGLAFSPDGATIATAGYTDKMVKLTDVTTGELRHTLTGHPERLFCVAYAPDGRTVAAGGYSGSDTTVGVTLWDTGTAQVKHQLRMRWVWCVAFSLDSATIATGSDGGIVKLWDVASGEERLQLRGHTTTVKAVTFSPDGKTLATGSADQTIKLWDVVTGEERATLVGHTDWVGALAFAPDGRTLASGDWRGEVRLWRAAKDDREIGPQRPH